MFHVEYYENKKKPVVTERKRGLNVYLHRTHLFQNRHYTANIVDT